MRWTIHRVAERELGFLRAPGVMSRFLVFLVLPTTPIIFGLSVYTFLIDAPGNPLTDQVIRWLGLAYGVAAILTALGEAWLVVRRRALPYRGPEFTRVLVLAVIPETVVLFTLIVAIQAASFIIRGPTEPGLSPQEGEALIRACQFMMFGSVSAPLAAFLSNRVSTLEQKPFSRALLLEVVGEIPVFLALILALQQMTGLR